MPTCAREAKTHAVPVEERDPAWIPRIALRVSALGALAFSAATVAEYFIPTARYCEPGGGCDQVRAWSFGQVAFGVPLGLVLPLLGVLGFTALFAGSLVRDRVTTRVVAAMAIAGALIAAALLWAQATQIGSWCWLCVGVDSFAVGAGISAIALLVASRGAAERGGSMRSPWWAAWIVVAFGPLAFSSTAPDPDIPPVIRELYEPRALNVVELADFECPYCRAMNPVLESVLAGVHDRPVNLVRVMVPLPFHTHARDAAKAYYCAVRMDHGEPMASALFRAEDISPAANMELARSLGMDAGAFERCLSDPEIEARIRADEQIARQSHNQGLPTVFIGDRELLGFDASAGAEPYQEAVDAALRGEGARRRVWPLASVALGAIIAFIWGRRRKR